MAEPLAKRRKMREREGLGDGSVNSPIITDPRFAGIQSDPRYRPPTKRHTHVKLDKRFSRILHDEDFGRRAKVDRYGRPLGTDIERQRLKRRYEFEEENEEASGDEVDDDVVVQRELERVEKTYDPLREGGYSSSSSDGSSSDEDDEDLAQEVQPALGGEQSDIPMGEVSSRLAVVNLDWDNIRAADLMAVFSSFLPADGRLLNISIYPSEFGKERMEREEMEGPPKEIFSSLHRKGDGTDPRLVETDDEADVTVKPDEGEEFDSTRLRQYQLERLRYFYAILKFSSANAAKAIYDAVDGTEYLSTANFFDLRFVPDETDFSDNKPREECQKIPDGYRPNEFVTDALQHSKVKLTWDAEDQSRKEAQARAFRGARKEIDENDLKAYLGTDSSSDDDEQEFAGPVGDASSNAGPMKEMERQRMRALFGLAAEPANRTKKGKGPVGDLQITFSSGLSGQNGDKTSVFENESEIDETTAEKYVRKERERKQRRKEKVRHARDSATAGASKSDAVNTELEQGNTGPIDLGFDDPFFAAPESDKTASKVRKEERRKKRAQREAEEAASAAKRAELELLMADDRESGVKHFNMNEIEKAAKRIKKKGKKSKGHKAGDELVTDEFKIDTQDPRFSRLFENHEFAIDPTNPRFKDTPGMKALLDESRKRRRVDLDSLHRQSSGGGKDVRRIKAAHQQQDRAVIANGEGKRLGKDNDLESLVQKLKKKKTKEGGP